MHQVLNRKDAMAYLSGRQDGSLSETDLQASPGQDSIGDWWDVTDAAISGVLDSWRGSDLNAMTSDQSRDQLEGELSAGLHSTLKDLPASVLSDRDFWRYLAAGLYEFVLWRQPSKTVSALQPYFGVANDSLGPDCVPLRMFDRAYIANAGAPAESEDPYELARFGAADVWKSHILRVRNSYAPIVVRELLVDVKDGKLPTDRVRVLAKNLKRVRSNVLFEVLEPFQARELIDREQTRVTSFMSSKLDAADDEV